MPRTITVKGTGKVSATPNYVVLTMSLEARNLDYNQAMERSATQLDQLNKALLSMGFEEDALKTTDFHVRTDYAHVQDKSGTYHNEFNGFVCSHSLKLEFDFDTQRLAQALSTVSDCLAQPELAVAFTVKDTAPVADELLREATINGRKKAESLCEASGVILGPLLSIDYNFGDLNPFSNTRYSMGESNLRGAAPMMAKSMDIRPDDISVTDTATFVWEIN